MVIYQNQNGLVEKVSSDKSSDSKINKELLWKCWILLILPVLKWKILFFHFTMILHFKI